MSIVINAKGTSVPYFKIGKSGTTLYQGSTDPSLSYAPENGDIWFNTSINALESWSSPMSNWIAPRLADLNFSGSSIIAGPSADLSLQTDSGNNVLLNAGTGNPILSTIVGKDLHITESIGGGLYLNVDKWPSSDGSIDQVLSTNGSGELNWIDVGTVTSIGLTDSSITSIYNITNSPITTSGSLTITLANQSANSILSAPVANSGQPSFRNLEYADLPLKLYVENPIFPTSTLVTGTNAIAIGDGANASIYGMKGFANGKFSNMGDAQHGVYILRNITTDATPTDLFLDGGSQVFIIPNNSVVSFSIIIAARRTDGTGGSGYKFDGIITKDITSSSVSFIGTPSKTILGETDSIWDINISANTGNGALKITVTGESSKTIRWVATILTTETTN